MSVEHDGDDWNTPRTTTIKSKIHSLEVDICDKNGDEVEDENDLILTNYYTFYKIFMKTNGQLLWALAHYRVFHCRTDTTVARDINFQITNSRANAHRNSRLGDYSNTIICQLKVK